MPHLPYRIKDSECPIFLTDKRQWMSHPVYKRKCIPNSVYRITNSYCLQVVYRIEENWMWLNRFSQTRNRSSLLHITCKSHHEKHQWLKYCSTNYCKQKVPNACMRDIFDLALTIHNNKYDFGLKVTIKSPL